MKDVVQMDVMDLIPCLVILGFDNKLTNLASEVVYSMAFSNLSIVSLHYFIFNSIQPLHLCSFCLKCSLFLIPSDWIRTFSFFNPPLANFWHCSQNILHVLFLIIDTHLTLSIRFESKSHAFSPLYFSAFHIEYVQ